MRRFVTAGIISAAAALCSAALCSAQSQNPAITPSAKADAIYLHANVYTGVPASVQFSSVLREQAVAVRGDRIQAVGKNADIEKLKGPQTQIWADTSSCQDSTMRMCIWSMGHCGS
jgi:hypothetical protein